MTSTLVCHWHAERETRLRCGSCGRAICVECTHQHPVGVRCRECVSFTPLPTLQISRSYVVRGVSAVIGMGIGGGIGLSIVLSVLPGAGFLFFFLMVGLGYAMAEGISVSVNRRRGRFYQYLGLAAVVLATLPIIVISLPSLSVGALFNLAGVGVAATVAWNRLAP